MADLHRIGMLWVAGPLSYLEQLCIQSFLDVGHPVILYHYAPISGVPEGVELVHGSAVLDRDEFIANTRTGSTALFSDVFRYHMLSEGDHVIWADTDAYCVKPFTTETGHFFAWESEHHINGGVLGLPRDSPALQGLLEMTKDEYGIPFWYGPRATRRLTRQADAGTPVHVSDMPWGVWGPHAVTAWLQRTGEDKHALSAAALYPVAFEKRRHLVKARRLRDVQAMITEETRSIHFYGRRVREYLALNPNGLPDEGGLLHMLLKKHAIDPGAAPIPHTDKIKRKLAERQEREEALDRD
ncbi:hypothetical protein [Roseobacter sp.]|uniref:hypothetical protein n=1 Tax=Roseobacter sp. TaxID=1907202 RepID=UPI0029667E6A|nr:hypothetical protein [Roseobacter sp.]